MPTTVIMSTVSGVTFLNPTGDFTISFLGTAGTLGHEDMRLMNNGEVSDDEACGFLWTKLWDTERVPLVDRPNIGEINGANVRAWITGHACVGGQQQWPSAAATIERYNLRIHYHEDTHCHWVELGRALLLDWAEFLATPGSITCESDMSEDESDMSDTN